MRIGLNIQSAFHKLICFMLLVAIVAAWVPCTHAAAATEPVVILDLSQYNGTAASIKNSVTGNDTSFTLGGTPVKGSFVNINGEVTNYLQLGEVDSPGVADSTTTDRVLTIADSSMIDQTETTVSFWMYDEGCRTGGYSRYFMLTNGSKRAYGLRYNAKSGDSLCSWDKTFGSAGPDKDVTFEMRDKCWKLVTITRTYDSGEGTQSYYAQVNPVGGTQTKASLTTDALTSRKSETGFFFQFGLGIACKIGGIKMYNRALTSDEINAIYNDECDDFLEGADSMTLESCTPSDGIISATGGTITLEFNNYVDPDTLGGISFTKADGSSVHGKVGVTMPEKMSKTVNITFGELTGGEEYKLVFDGVTSLNGFTLDIEELVFTAGESYYVHADFEDYDEGSIDGIAGLSVRSGTGDWSGYEIRTDSATGRKYLDMVPITSGKEGADTAYNFLEWVPDSGIAGENIAAEIKFRAGKRDAEGNAEAGVGMILCTIFSPDTTQNYSSTVTGSTGGASGDNAKNINNDKKDFTTTADSDGWHWLKIVTGTDDEGRRVVDYYYDRNNLGEYNHFVRDDKAYGALFKIVLSRLWTQKAAHFGVQNIEVDELSIYKHTAPGVVYAQSTEYVDAYDTIYFTADIDEESLEEADIYYVDEDGKKIYAKLLSYDEEERSASLELDSYLMYGKSYKLYIDGAMTVAGILFPEGSLITIDTPEYDVVSSDIIFKDAVTGDVVECLSDAQTINAEFTLTNNGEDSETSLIIIHKDNTNRIKNVEWHVVELPAEEPVIKPVSDKEFAEGDTITLMLWHETMTGAKTILDSPVVLNYLTEQ